AAGRPRQPGELKAALEKSAGRGVRGWRIGLHVVKSLARRGDRTLDFAGIIRDFAHSERVPVAAIRAATAEPEAFVQQAIALLQRIHAGRSTIDEEEAMPVLVHVLG